MTVSGGFENSVPEAILTQAKNPLLTTYIELELFKPYKHADFYFFFAELVIEKNI